MRRLHFGLYTLFLVLLGLLSYLAHQSNSLPSDISISLWLQETVPSLVAPIMEAVSFLGKYIPAGITVALVAVVLLLFRRRLEAIFVVILPAAAWGVNTLLKLLVDRPRPGDDPLGGGNSFPSGHTTYAAVLGGFIFYLAPRLLKYPVAARAVQFLVVVFVLLTGLSRVYLGAHQPSDILGSLLLGGLLLAPAFAIYNTYTRGTKRKSEVTDA